MLCTLKFFFFPDGISYGGVSCDLPNSTGVLQQMAVVILVQAWSLLAPLNALSGAHEPNPQQLCQQRSLL